MRTHKTRVKFYKEKNVNEERSSFYMTNGSSLSLHHWFPFFFPFTLLVGFEQLLAVSTSLLPVYPQPLLHSLSPSSSQYRRPSWQPWPALRPDPVTANMISWCSLRSASWRPLESEYPASQTSSFVFFEKVKKINSGDLFSKSDPNCFSPVFMIIVHSSIDGTISIRHRW